MGRRPPSLAPAWARMAEVALARAKRVVASSPAHPGAPRLVKMEVRRGGGRLHLLWLMQPEDGDLVDHLMEVRRRLACSAAIKVRLRVNQDETHRCAGP